MNVFLLLYFGYRLPYVVCWYADISWEPVCAIFSLNCTVANLAPQVGKGHIILFVYFLKVEITCNMETTYFK